MPRTSKSVAGAILEGHFQTEFSTQVFNVFKKENVLRFSLDDVLTASVSTPAEPLFILLVAQRALA